MRTQTRSSPQHPRPHHDVNSCSGLRMVKRARIGPLRPPLPLARCGRRGAKNFSPQESRQHCVPQKSPCLWHNLTRKVSPRTIVTRGRAVVSGLDTVACARYVQGNTKWRKSGLQRHRPESLGLFTFYRSFPSALSLCLALTGGSFRNSCSLQRGANT